MSAAIKLIGVTKTYGRSRGVTNLDFDVEKGTVFGFLGPNGAGKSTTINMLIDLIRPSKGQINILGLSSTRDSVAIHKRIGYLTGDMSLDESLTGRQQLEYFANLHGGVPERRIRELAKVLELDLNRKIKTLSRGNRQKVGLVSALMHDPELLILDEPTTGLDPLIQAQFNKIILNNKKRGRTTFLSSHLLSEVQEICDHVAFIGEGKILAIQDMNDIAAGAPKRIHVVSTDLKLLASLKKLPNTKVSKSTHRTIDLTYAGDVNPLVKLLAKHRVVDVTIQDADLESVFMEHYKRGKNV